VELRHHPLSLTTYIIFNSYFTTRHIQCLVYLMNYETNMSTLKSEKILHNTMQTSFNSNNKKQNLYRYMKSIVSKS